MSEERNTVLVIEDNQEHLMAMAIKLRAHGFDIVSAGDGATAMTVVNREKPNAIVLDLGLPGGDGFVVLQRLRSLASTVALPVVVVTARPAQTNRAVAPERGVVAFLQKPVKTSELLTAPRNAPPPSQAAERPPGTHSASPEP